MKPQTSILIRLITILTAATIISGCKLDLPNQSANNENAKTATNTTSVTLNTTFPEWNTATPGIQFTSLQIPDPNQPEPPSKKTTKLTPQQNTKDFLIIKINPALNQLNIIENPPPPSAKTIAELHEQHNSHLTFNGGFFTPEFNPTGLLISNSKTLNPLSNADLLNGIFAIDTQNKPTIISPIAPISPENYPFAIQNGPILILNGTPQIKTDDKKPASRTVIAINANNEIFIIMLKQSLLHMDNALSLYQLAQLIKENPNLNSLNITSALNLDGGTSTGLYIKDRYYPEMEKVQNIIITTPHPQALE